MKKQQTTTTPEVTPLHTQGDVVYHKHWGKCEVIKQIDTHGYVVQSEKKPTGEYLNVDDWDFIEENIYPQTLFIDKIIKEGERMGYSSTNLGIFINGAVFCKDLVKNERQALLDALEKLHESSTNLLVEVIEIPHPTSMEEDMRKLSESLKRAKQTLNNAKNIQQKQG